MIHDVLELLISAVGVIIACRALYETKKQQEISNKHSLFDKRMQIYIKAQSLVQVYQHNKPFFDDICIQKERPETKSVFEILTSWSGFSNVMFLVDENIGNSQRIRLLQELNSLSEKAKCIQFLFEKEKFTAVEEFISSYISFLWKTFLYYELTESVHEIVLKKSIPLEESMNQVGEKRFRQEWFEMLNTVDTSYEEIIQNDLITKMEDVIKIGQG